MPTFLQPVDLPERCFLQEVLYWVAFQRLPLASYTLDGKEIRDTDEVGGYAVEVTQSVVTEDETARAGIPPDPDWVALVQDRTMLPVAHYDKLLARSDLDDVRRKFEIEREAATAYGATRDVRYGPIADIEAITTVEAATLARVAKSP